MDYLIKTILQNQPLVPQHQNAAAEELKTLSSEETKIIHPKIHGFKINRYFRLAMKYQSFTPSAIVKIHLDLVPIK